MIPRKVYLLHSKEGVHLIASNFKAVYMALQDLSGNIDNTEFKSYQWYCYYLNSNQDVAIPDRSGGHYTVSRRPVLTKYTGHLKEDTCLIPNFQKT